MTDNTKSPGPSVLKRALLGVAVLAVGVGVALLLMATGPKAKQKPRARDAALVEVRPVHFTDHMTRVRALGTVTPARSVNLAPRVSGDVVWLSENMIPGGYVTGGERIVQLDRSDYEVAIQQREADLARARAELALEMGQQEIAAREYELFNNGENEENASLALREPQLARARSAVMSAEAALSQARLNLSRTAVRAPFNAVVLRKHVSLGSQAGPGAPVAQLAGTDESWIEVSVPVAQLRWITAGENGSTVRVYNESAWGPDVFREGTVLRILGNLDAQSRMARLLVSIPDPLSRTQAYADEPALLLDSYVRVEILGARIDGVAAIERSTVRAGDRAWVMNDDNRLEIRPLDIIYSDHDSVFVASGLAEGERLVVSDLSAAVEGRPLRINGNPDAQNELQ